MTNKLSFCMALFCLLLVGKIGHIGTLDKVNDWLLVALFIADFIFDMVDEVRDVWVKQGAKWINYRYIDWQLRKAARRLGKKK